MDFDYIVVERNSIAEFREAVRELLKYGWHCQGGVCAIYVKIENPRKGYTEGETWYSQAMVSEGWDDSNIDAPQDTSSDDLPILMLGTRLCYALKRAGLGITTVSQVTKLKGSFLLTLYGIGPVVLSGIVKKLQSIGLSLAPEGKQI